MSARGAVLTGVVVHWHGEASLAALAAAWPVDPRFPLLVVDNGSQGLDRVALPPTARVLEPGRNLGFAGGVNLGLANAESAWVLLLNPDARPLAGALEALLEGIAAHPDALGLVPRLLSPDGVAQTRWQLRELPRPGALLAQCLLLPTAQGPRREPPAGSRIGQPAAAALALDRAGALALGGFATDYQPAWFEDVDFAARAGAAGRVFRYWPAAELVHELGGSLERLGYRGFLLAYYGNLLRYLGRHHGRGWRLAARVLLPLGCALRLLALPLRCPRRAASRRAAAAALVAVAAAALRGFAPAPAGDGGA